MTTVTYPYKILKHVVNFYLCYFLCRMARKILTEEEITQILYEDIPDGDSFCGGDSDDDPDELEDPSELPFFDEGGPSDDEEENVPLSVIARRLQHAVPSTSRADTPETRPIWKKSFTMPKPGDFKENVDLPEHVKSMENPTPLKLFKLFWSDEFVEKICFHTNLYATQTQSSALKPATKEETDIFIALNLVMGIKKSPSYRDYWSSASDLKDEFISSFMPFNRFSWFLHYLHLNDNTLMPEYSSPDYDKLYKVRPLLDEMSRKFGENYTCTERVAIDESMVKFTGRSSIKQYMPKKPIKRGYKIWMKCASTGYCLAFSFYQGKEGDKVQKGLGEKVVKTFCDDLESKNHKVYFDNYFNSYNLQTDLQKKSVLACGTVNPTRKNLPTLKEDKKMCRGDIDYRVSNTNVSFLKWKDKRSVYVLSNFHDPKETDTVKRRERTGESKQVTCPAAVIDYNKNMNFVDKFDQLKSCYSIDRKSHKWWHRIFFHFLDCAVVNAFIIYRVLQADGYHELEKISSKDFRRRVYLDMLAPALVSKYRGRSSVHSSRSASPSPAFIKHHKPSVSTEVRLQQSKHKPIRGTSRRCANCSTKRKPVRTIYICETCKVPLCIRKGKNCFNDFHNKK